MRKPKRPKCEQKHLDMLKSMGCKPLPPLPKQKPSLPGQRDLFEGQEELTVDTCPEDHDG